MYVVLVNNDGTLSAPKKERIIQRSKLFDKFWFLVPPCHNGIDVSNCTVVLEYLKPVSKEYKSEILKLSEDRYEEYLKYVLPIDTEFTAEAGSLEVQLSFIYVDIDADGNSKQRVGKTAPPLKIEIVPLSAWSDIIPDSSLSAVDQRIIKVDAQLKALNDAISIIDEEKVDNLKYEDGKLQLMANDKEIGEAINIKSCEENLEDGIPVVDFENSISSESPDNSGNDDDDNVVEF